MMSFPPTESSAGLEHANLLCNEDACTCLFNDDDDNGDIPGNASASCENDNKEDSYSFETSMFLQEESEPSELQVALGELFVRERHYAPQVGLGVDVAARRKAVGWLLKMCELFKFTPYTATLSINYFDRFLLQHQLLSGKAWTMQLLSVACLSLAAKMEEIEVPVLLDLQVEADLVFEPRTLQRMELLVLSTLGWKMSSVTPISFISFFINRWEPGVRTNKVLITRMHELILSSTLEFRFLRFLPSSIAAAATVCAFQEILPLQVAEQRNFLSRAMPHQLQVDFTDCCALMIELFSPLQCLSLKEATALLVPQSPVAVLDASFSSNSMSNATANNHSCPPISSPSPLKKRRMEGPS